jgi:hypothetical protein
MMTARRETGSCGYAEVMKLRTRRTTTRTGLAGRDAADGPAGFSCTHSFCPADDAVQSLVRRIGVHRADDALNAISRPRYPIRSRSRCGPSPAAPTFLA